MLTDGYAPHDHARRAGQVDLADHRGRRRLARAPHPADGLPPRHGDREPNAHGQIDRHRRHGSGDAAGRRATDPERTGRLAGGLAGAFIDAMIDMGQTGQIFGEHGIGKTATFFSHIAARYPDARWSSSRRPT